MKFEKVLKKGLSYSQAWWSSSEVNDFPQAEQFLDWGPLWEGVTSCRRHTIVRTGEVIMANCTHLRSLNVDHCHPLKVEYNSHSQ